MKRITLAITLLTFTTACATLKKKPSAPEETQIQITPGELTEIFQIQNDKFAAQLEALRKDFAEVEKRITSLRNQVAKQVKDCLCPGEMK